MRAQRCEYHRLRLCGFRHETKNECLDDRREQQHDKHELARIRRVGDEDGGSKSSRCQPRKRRDAVQQVAAVTINVEDGGAERRGRKSRSETLQRARRDQRAYGIRGYEHGHGRGVHHQRRQYGWTAPDVIRERTDREQGHQQAQYIGGKNDRHHERRQTEALLIEMIERGWGGAACRECHGGNSGGGCGEGVRQRRAWLLARACSASAHCLLHDFWGDWCVAPQSFEPPSTATMSPVIQRASSDTRKAMTEATSPGWPIRFRDCMPITVLRPSSVLVKFDMSVSITPGATALTRMPRGPRAAAQYLTSVLMAPLVAE